MDISQRGLDLIKDYESFSSEAYLCPEGVPTIGWGSIRWDAKTPVKLGDRCTEQQAETLLRKEIQRIEDAIDNSVQVPLTQGQFDALCSWGYNVGTGWIDGRRKGGAATLIKYLNKGQYEKVPSELLKFKRGAVSGKSYNGLLNRRKREIAELWLADVAQEPGAASVKPAMPQQVEPEKHSTEGLIRDSRTLQSVLAAALAYIAEKFLGVYEFMFGIAKDAGPEIMTLKTTLSPFEPLFKIALPTVVIVGLAVAWARRRSARIEGREG